MYFNTMYTYIIKFWLCTGYTAPISQIVGAAFVVHQRKLAASFMFEMFIL